MKAGGRVHGVCIYVCSMVYMLLHVVTCVCVQWFKIVVTCGYMCAPLLVVLNSVGMPQ